MADDKVKLEGQRNAIREHIDKYKAYPNEWDKQFALKTIRRCQSEIQDLIAKHKHWLPSWEDTWFPGASEK